MSYNPSEVCICPLCREWNNCIINLKKPFISNLRRKNEIITRGCFECLYTLKAPMSDYVLYLYRYVDKKLSEKFRNYKF